MGIPAPLRRTLGPLVTAALLSSCGNGLTDLPGNLDYLAARERWERVAPPDYSFTLGVSCFCLLESPMRVTVRDHVVVSVVELGASHVPPGSSLPRVTIDDVFDVILGAMAKDGARITAEYDRQRGFPTTLFVDWYADHADDEIRYAISDVVFGALP